MPFKCENERHSYEKCQYEEYEESSRQWHLLAITPLADSDSFKKRVKEFEAQKE